MTRNEWISALTKARSLADGKDETCSNLLGFIIDGIKSLPVLYRFGDELYEEEEEDDD